MNLQDKVAIVTGSTRGIGRAIAEALVRNGARVTVSGRSQPDSERVAAEIARAAGDGKESTTLPVACDVRRLQDCQQLVSQTLDRFGRLDILVNNAGIGAFAPVAEMSPETWDAVLETNLSGVFYCTNAALPHLRKAGDAWVINIGSLAGKNAFPNGAAYNASKFGLIGFSEALMQEVRYDNIRVSYVMPGSVATEFNGREASEGEDWRIAAEDVAQVVLDVLGSASRTLVSRVEMRPSQPPRR